MGGYDTGIRHAERNLAMGLGHWDILTDRLSLRVSADIVRCAGSSDDLDVTASCRQQRFVCKLYINIKTSFLVICLKPVGNKSNSIFYEVGTRWRS
jgi:hypothetical protein